MESFEVIYNATWGARPGAIKLSPAPAPRRFAQGMVGTFALVIGVLITLEWKTATLIFELILLAAVAALVFGKFCLGSSVYHLLRGQGDCARQTLPLKRPE